MRDRGGRDRSVSVPAAVIATRSAYPARVYPKDSGGSQHASPQMRALVLADCPRPSLCCGEVSRPRRETIAIRAPPCRLSFVATLTSSPSRRAQSGVVSVKVRCTYKVCPAVYLSGARGHMNWCGWRVDGQSAMLQNEVAVVEARGPVGWRVSARAGGMAGDGAQYETGLGAGSDR